MYKHPNTTFLERNSFSKYLSVLRTIIITFLCTLLLVGIMPPPLLTYLAPAQLDPLAQAAANLLPEPSVAMAQSCSFLAGDLGGTVWYDADTDGVKDSTESGVDGTTGPMTVEAYDRNSNNPVATTNVGADGTYFFSGLFTGVTGDDARFRLEFKGLPAGYAYSIHGLDNGTAVQFHNGRSCDADLGLHVPPSTLCAPVADALVRTYSMAMTCGADDTTDKVMELKDISGLAYNSSTQNPPAFSHADWTLDKIGNIYFTEFDDEGNIYGTASGFVQQDIFPQNDNTPALQQYGSIGATTASGTVYKFDAVTGAPTVFSTLPQGGGTSSDTDPGLGGITHRCL